jgi:photosystem II stability/assembly factor-like uncharacterized protein
MKNLHAASILVALWALSGEAPCATVLDSGAVSGLGARNIGSASMSGRISAIAARAEDDGKVTLFVGSASGGVWRSFDGGTSFKPVFDRQPVQSIGAIALDPSRPKVVWVGTGEGWTRNSVSIGDGIWRSEDGGDTWQHLGLAESERFNRIIVHPKRSEVVYACVPGKLWSDSADRGLYKTEDGGASWKLVLSGPNLSTGCSGLAMDPRNPERLFAGLWDFRRKGWTFRSGGDGPAAASGSGLFLTEDGGRSWHRLDAKSAPGLPAGPWGRLDVAIAPSDPQRVYAVIEGTSSALFRSDDGGRTWSRKDDSQRMVWRPFYFSRLVIDPTNPDRLFKPNLALIASEDGGASFTNVNGGTHGDHHDIWIDPRNPRHIVTGDDGGLWTSYDGGNRWWKSNNLPVSQFYHVSADLLDPYKVYGGLQDNSSWVGDSSYPSGITNSRWENLYNSDGFWVFVDPSDPAFVYAEGQGGFVGRIDRRTLASRDIQPKAGYHEKLRWNWNTPLHLSRLEKGKLYIGSQFLFVTRDGGATWSRISPDLTTNDPEKQKQEQSGGITVDNSSAEMHTTIYSISESPRDSKTVWVGTDDGRIQLTRDAGGHWASLEKNVPGLPPASWVSWIEAGAHADGTAYASFDRHSFGDMTPWVYATRDFGASWKRIVGGDSGVRGYAHVVREDPVRPGLLYLGTEFGLWISLDDGAHWAQFRGGNFPAVAVRDIAFQERESDLVLATHGRGIWIIDDLTALRGLTAEVLAKDTALLPSRPIRQKPEASGGWAEGDASYAGANPPTGVTISYFLSTRHTFGRLKLEVLDASGRVVANLAASGRKGINRVSWEMHEKPPRVPPAAAAIGAQFGPRVLPGSYTVRLTRGTQVLEAPLVVRLDPRSPFTPEDRRVQYEAVMRAHGLFSRMSAVVDRLNGFRALAAERLAGAPKAGAARAALEEFSGRADALRKEIVATSEGGAITGEERLREHLAYVYDGLNSFEGRPGDYQVERVSVLERELGEVEQRVRDLAGKDLPALNERLRADGLESIAREQADEEGLRIAAESAWERLLEGREEGVAAARSRQERD